MNLSENGEQFIRLYQKAHEIVKDEEGTDWIQAYREPISGIICIGYGHKDPSLRLKNKDGSPYRISFEQAIELFIEDVEAAEKIINAHVTVELTQNQFDALVSFVLDVGPGNYRRQGFTNSRLLKLINEKKFEDATKEILTWTQAKNSKGEFYADPYLTRRRAIEASLFTQHIQPNGSPTPTKAQPVGQKKLIKSRTMWGNYIAALGGGLITAGPQIEKIEMFSWAGDAGIVVGVAGLMLSTLARVDDKNKGRL